MNIHCIYQGTNFQLSLYSIYLFITIGNFPFMKYYVNCSKCDDVPGCQVTIFDQVDLVTKLTLPTIETVRYSTLKGQVHV